MPEQRCTVCAQVKPLDDFGRVNKLDPFPKLPYCRKCSHRAAKQKHRASGKANVTARKAYAADPERGRKKTQAYREQHPERVKASFDAWHAANPGALKAASDAWRSQQPAGGLPSVQFR